MEKRVRRSIGRTELEQGGISHGVCNGTPGPLCIRGCGWIVGTGEVAAAQEQSVDDDLERDKNGDEKDREHAKAAIGPFATLLKVQVLNEHGLDLKGEGGAQCAASAVDRLHVVGDDFDSDVVCSLHAWRCSRLWIAVVHKD